MENIRNERKFWKQFNISLPPPNYIYVKGSEKYRGELKAIHSLLFLIQSLVCLSNTLREREGERGKEKEREKEWLIKQMWDIKAIQTLSIFWDLSIWTMMSTSPVAQMVKNIPAMQKIQVWFLGWEDPMEKGMATHSSILAWRIPWAEEPGKLQSMGWQSQTWLSD